MSFKPGSEAHMQYYAQFAKAAYNVQKQEVPAGFLKDVELSNRNRTIWYNPDTFEVVYAERGTIPKGNTAMADLGTDAALALGLQGTTARFRNAAKTAKKLQDKYEGWDVTATGHSLGGSIVKYLHDNLDMRAVTFSAHLPTREIFQDALVNTVTGGRRQLHQYTVPYDPVGVGSFISGSAYAVKQTAKDPHAIDNFIQSSS